MSSIDTRKDPTLICSKCKRFEAKRTCDVCHDYICLACSRKTFVKFTGGSGGYKDKLIKFNRCICCLSKLPDFQIFDRTKGRLII